MISMAQLSEEALCISLCSSGSPRTNNKMDVERCYEIVYMMPDLCQVARNHKQNCRVLSLTILHKENLSKLRCKQRCVDLV